MTKDRRNAVGKASDGRQVLSVDELIMGSHVLSDWYHVGDIKERREGSRARRVTEVTTLLQSFSESGTAVDADAELETYLNDGWDIMLMTVSSFLETIVDVEEVWHYRVVILRRGVKAKRESES